MRHLTCDPKLEVKGQAALSLVENIRAEEIKPMLEKHGFSHIDPDQWYSAQDFLNMLNDLAKESDFMTNLVAIGLKLAEQAPMPPEVETLEQLLPMYDVAYQMNHRNADAGQILCEQMDDRYYKFTLNDIYPDDLSYGSIYGFAKRFLPDGTQFTVKYDEITTRDRGGDRTILHLTWE